MKWINCKDRVELDKYGNSVLRHIKYKYAEDPIEKIDVAYVGKRGKSGNFYIVFESTGWDEEVIIEGNKLEYCYWLDETDQSLVDVIKPLNIKIEELELKNKLLSSKNDWQSIEERFTKEYHGRVLKNNPMLCWEIVQWFKENVKCIGK